MFDLNTREKGSIIGTILLVLVCIQLYFIVSSSISKWGKHPQQIECTLSTDTCTVKGYSYEHSFCADEFFRKYHDAIHKYCELPKHKDYEKELPKLSEIDSAEIKSNGKYSDIYIVTKTGERVLWASKIDYSKANVAVKDFKESLDWCHSDADTLTDDKQLSVWVE